MSRSNVKQVIVVRRDLNMRKGKLAAQVGHASMAFLTENNDSNRNDELFVKLSPKESLWLKTSRAKIVCGVEGEDELNNLITAAEIRNIEVHKVIDAGYTEFHGVPTLTCAAFGPEEDDVLDKITGALKLL